MSSDHLNAYYKSADVFIRSYVAYLEFSWILRVFLLKRFTLSSLCVCLIRVFVFYLLRGCLIPNTLLWYLCASWFQGPNIHLLFFLVSLSLISLLIGMTSIISSQNFLNRLPCVGLIMKYHIVSFLGHHSTFNSFLLIRSVMKKKQKLMFLVRLLLYDFPLFSRRMELLFFLF